MKLSITSSTIFSGGIRMAKYEEIDLELRRSLCDLSFLINEFVIDL